MGVRESSLDLILNLKLKSEAVSVATVTQWKKIHTYTVIHGPYAHPPHTNTEHAASDIVGCKLHSLQPHIYTPSTMQLVIMKNWELSPSNLLQGKHELVFAPACDVMSLNWIDRTCGI